MSLLPFRSLCLYFLYSLLCLPLALSDTIRINEVMASNGSTLADEDGDFEDWIELYNYGSETVDLSGWGLSDNQGNPFKWVFPEGVIIPANQYLLVWASGKDRPSDFTVNGAHRQVFQGIPGEAVSDLTESPDFPDSPDLSEILFNGFEAPSNVDDNYGQLIEAIVVAPDSGDYRFWIASSHQSALFLATDGNPDNAVQVATVPNFTGIRDYGKYGGTQRSNWVTLSAGQSIYVKALMKTGEGADHLSVRWRRPPNIFEEPIPGSTMATPFSFFEFFPAELHTNFSISASGEELVLTRPDGTLIDEMPALPIPRDFSFGRIEGQGDSWFYFDNPQPNGPNPSSGLTEILPPPAFSHQAGFYSDGFNLSVNHPDSEVTILYTLDGTEPDPANLGGTTYQFKTEYPRNGGDTTLGPLLDQTIESFTYSSPIPITDRSNEPDRLAPINTQFTYAPNTPSNPAFKGTTIRAKAFKLGAIPSDVVNASFFVNPEIDERYSLPVISMILPEDRLFDYNTGIYVPGVVADNWRLANPNDRYGLGKSANFNRRGQNWEVPGFVEFFQGNGDRLLGQGIGARMHGGVSRGFPLKTFRLYARSEYDSSNSLDFDIFDGRPKNSNPSENLTSFRRLLLRNSGNDSQRTFYRDGFAQELISHLPIDRQAYRPAVHFINGEYWGLINIRERLDQHYIYSHYAVDEEDLVIMSKDLVEFGESGDASHWNSTVNFAESNDMSLTENLEWVASRVDLDDLINHYSSQIYFNNRDWPQNNLDWWRKRSAYNPNAPAGHDGRWRFLMYDTDFCFWLSGGPNTNSLARVIELTPGEQGMGVLVGRRVNRLFRRLALNNEVFRHQFISTMADGLNSYFKPEQVNQTLQQFEARIGPYRNEHNARWGDGISYESGVQSFANQRPNFMRQHITGVFNLAGTSEVTVHPAPLDHGQVKLNSLLLGGDTPGLPEPDEAFTGTYFQGVPVKLTAIPAEGYQFAGWIVQQGPGTAADTIDPVAQDDQPSYFSTDAEIEVDPLDDTTIEPVFEPIPLSQLPIALHNWDFEDNGVAINSPSFTIGGAALIIDTDPFADPQAQAIFNTGGDFVTQHLRLNNPLTAGLTFQLPSTGYSDLSFDFLTRRSGSGAGQMTVEFTTDGSTWQTHALSPLAIENDSPQPFTLDFSDQSAANDNPDFAVRFAFVQGDGGTEGNNRFDDISLIGTALPGTNLPPVVDPDALPSGLQLTAGGPSDIIDLGDFFSDPDGDSLSYTFSSSNPLVLNGAIGGSLLDLNALQTGDAVITIEASDGNNPPVSAEFHVLVLPPPFALASGSFVFDSWGPSTPAGIFPDHMIFLQSDINDPTLADDLPFAYQIPADDAAQPADVNFPYEASSRTRINGLGDEGIAFINTGRGRDLGAALLALDTTGESNIQVAWTAGTVLPNNRIYALRLQYRLGTTGDWTDVEEAGSPVEYLRNALPDHSEVIGPVTLPSEAENQPLVHLRWKYHYLSGSGSRAQLRLDDIQVSSGTPSSATQLAFDPLTFSHWQTGVTTPPITVRALDADGLLASDFEGMITLNFNGNASPDGTFSLNAVNGIATFEDFILSGSLLTSGSLTANASGLTPGQSAQLTLSPHPVFTPPLSEDWDANENWTSVNFPNAAGLSAFIPPAAPNDRNVNLRSPITIGHLLIDNADSPFRNRLRDRSSGNTLTFDGNGDTATLHIVDNGDGFVEFNNEAGTHLASDLLVTVDPISGDTEFGALRLRETWSGPGGLGKQGPGRMTLTGSDKDFTGPIDILQGVLAVTDSATPAQSGPVTVHSGGQLRFISSSSDTNPIRTHQFGDQLFIAGPGRSGVPSGQQLGEIGALRYDPLSQDNHSQLLNPVTLTDDASIHVDGSRNQLELLAPLAGDYTVSKSGGGRLTFSADSPDFTGSFNLANGHLEVNATFSAPAFIGSDASLSGSGSLGNISGAGVISLPADSQLTATSSSGLNFQFGNDSFLRLSSPAAMAAPLNAANSVDLFLPQITPGDLVTIGFFSDQGADLAALSANATWNIFLPDPDGSTEFDGQTWSPWSGSIGQFLTVPHTLSVDGNHIQGTALRLVLGQALSGYPAWIATHFTQEQLETPNLDDPQTVTQPDGLPNLVRYALGLGANQSAAPTDLFTHIDQDGSLYLQFNRDADLTDITYQVESSNDLINWNTILYDSSLNPVNSHGNQHRVTLPDDSNPSFMRLRVDINTPD